jgi:hypothetical protein
VTDKLIRLRRAEKRRSIGHIDIRIGQKMVGEFRQADKQAYSTSTQCDNGDGRIDLKLRNENSLHDSSTSYSEMLSIRPFAIQTNNASTPSTSTINRDRTFQVHQLICLLLYNGDVLYRLHLLRSFIDN